MNSHGVLIAINDEAHPVKGFWSLLAPCLFLLLCGFQPALSRADTLDVCASGCPYSLVQAAVLAASDGDTIRLFYDGGQAGALIEPNILIDRDVTIEGFDRNETQLRGGSSQGTATGRVLRIAEGATVTLRNFILRAGSGNPGGCIRNDGVLTIESVGIAFCGSVGDGGAIHNGATGTLQLNDVGFSENWSSGNGGHIYNAGELLIHNSSLGLSYADLGGHIYSEGTMTISGSNFYSGSADEAGSIFVAEDATLHALGSLFQSNQASRNDAQVAQGGALLVHGEATIRNTTFRSNDANNPGGASRGGAIVVGAGGLNVGVSGVVSVSNSTLAQNGNGDMDSGGAIYVAGRGLVELANVTITENTARLGGGISVFSGAGCVPLCLPGTAEIANSIIYGNDSVDENLTDDCNGQLSSLGYNLVGVGGLPSSLLARCVLSGDTNGLQFNVDPLLDTSFPSGSDPKVAPLQAGSPAINAGNPAGCRDPQDQLLDTDQRHAPRVGNCDLGAYEYGSTPPIFSDGFEPLSQ